MLRWRLFGISFCIMPSFWLMNALMAYILYTQPMMRRHQAQGGNLLSRELLTLIVIWVLCSLVAVLVHELGHAVTGRLFGQPGNITISGLGGQAVGQYGELSPWKRILVIFAGPGAGFLFVAGLVAVDGTWWNWCMEGLVDLKLGLFWDSLKCKWFLIDNINPLLRMGDFPIYSIAVALLFFINLFTNMMNLFPIIPMDGGMIFKEICCLISPRAGLKVAFGVSFLLAAGLTLYLLLHVLRRYNYISQPDLWYPFALPELSLIIFGMMAFQSLQTYRQLAARERYSDYMQDDDMSGPRRVSEGVVEVEPKDPRDFARRAPGSERPRS